jgi:hypothetical protein
MGMNNEGRETCGAPPSKDGTAKAEAPTTQKGASAPQALESGYAYVAKGDIAVRGSIHNDDWETEVVSPRGDEYEIGRVRIDGTMCRVWWSPGLQANVAQVLR